MSPLQQIGSYRLIRLLGRGGMGAVYEAIQEPIERRVALKILLPHCHQHADTLSRFFNEAWAVNRIEHPGIVQVSDYGVAPDGTTYLVMEFLNGQVLSARLSQLRRTGTQMPHVAAARLAGLVADALVAAHRKGIVHRDLKPSNVMLVPDAAVPGGERAKVVDFGIAKLMQHQGKGTTPDVLMGTPQYMSPEQCRGASNVDEKTDVYALGVMLFEMLAGRVPFMAATPMELMGQHVFEEPPSVLRFAPGSPTELVDLVASLLQKDKALRPTMQQACERLACLAQQGASGLPSAVATATPMTMDNDAETSRLTPSSAPTTCTLEGSFGQAMRSPNWRRARAAAWTSFASAILAWVFLWGKAQVRLPKRAPSWAPTAVPAQPAQPNGPPAADLHRPAAAAAMAEQALPQGTASNQDKAPMSARLPLRTSTATRVQPSGHTRRASQAPPASPRSRPKTAADYDD